MEKENQELKIKIEELEEYIEKLEYELERTRKIATRYYRGD